jgi:hypothetical protein
LTDCEEVFKKIEGLVEKAKIKEKESRSGQVVKSIK